MRASEIITRLSPVDDVDVAVVLALHVRPMPTIDRDYGDEIREAIEENPIVAEARVAELEAVADLAAIEAALAEWMVRAHEQLDELLGSYEFGPSDTIKDVVARMNGDDRRRHALLEWATTLGSPFQLGPPDVALSGLVGMISADEFDGGEQ